MMLYERDNNKGSHRTQFHYVNFTEWGIQRVKCLSRLKKIKVGEAWGFTTHMYGVINWGEVKMLKLSGFRIKVHAFFLYTPPENNKNKNKQPTNETNKNPC